MNLNCTCNFCDNENAYHNGVNYECPDCDSEWDENGNLFNGYDEDDEGGTNEEFENLCQLEKPFFKLNHGKLYQCKVDFYNIMDKSKYETIVKQVDFSKAVKSPEKDKTIREYIKDHYNSIDLFSLTEKEFLEFALELK